MPAAMDDFRAGMEPQGESEAVLRYGLLVFALVFAIPLTIDFLVRAFA